MPPDSSSSEVNVFISHRMDDAAIARVIFDALPNFGIKQKNIFFTSATEQNQRPSAGEFLQRGIARGLHDCSLFILVFTRADEDWQWCMWELGMALDSNYLVTKKDFDTRIVVFQCTDDLPKIVDGLVRVTVDQPSILRFVQDLCTDAAYIPGKPPTLPNISNDVLQREAEGFFKRLQYVLPKQPGKEVWRWDWLKLKLKAEDIAAYVQETEADRPEFIRQKAMLTQAYGAALEHFNYRPASASFHSSGMFAINQPASMQELIDRWKRAKEVPGDSVPAWADEVVSEMMNSIEEDPASPQRELMKSARAHPSDWYYPIVNHVSRLADGSMEFIIYMYRLESAWPWLDDAVLSKGRPSPILSPRRHLGASAGQRGRPVGRGVVEMSR